MNAEENAFSLFRRLVEKAKPPHFLIGRLVEFICEIRLAHPF
jgi:hypothetical protein